MSTKEKNSQYCRGAFISEIDKRLAEFDRTHDWSETQAAERKKYERISKLRSKATTQLQEEKSIWDF